MCKVVEDPAEVLPVMPRLEPLVASSAEKIADPEARSVAERALGTLRKAAGKGEETRKKVQQSEALALLKASLSDASGEEDLAIHVAALAAMAANMKNFDATAWKDGVAFVPSFEVAAEELRAKLQLASTPVEEEDEDDDDGVDLYKGSFSLAYGTLTLLRETKMHLKRGRFYGLLGPNQCGKTTLMRAIANEQLEGFPKRDELRSVFVEHEIEDEEVGVQDK